MTKENHYETRLNTLMHKVRKGSLSRANGILVCQDNAISMPVNAMTGLSIREETLSAIISTAIIISLFLLFSFFDQLIEIFAIIGNYRKFFRYT